MLPNKIIFLFLSLVFVNACGPKLAINTSLANQGILGLSTEDPFFGPNIFLAKQMEKSNYLFSFVRQNGAPAALELEKRFLKNYAILMYYPDERAVYVAEPEESEVDVQWVVRGPVKPNWQDQKRAAQLYRTQNDSPVLYLFGRQERFGSRNQNNLTVAQALKPSIPPVSKEPKPDLYDPGMDSEPVATLQPVLAADNNSGNQQNQTNTETKQEQPPTDTTTDSQGNQVAPPTISKVKKQPSPSPSPSAQPSKEPEYNPLNTDQQAILMSQGFAERAPNGDIIHTVVSPDESISLIALWYTGKLFSAKAVALANQISIDEALVENERILIPAKLIKQYKKMPPDFVFSDDYKKEYGSKSAPAKIEAKKEKEPEATKKDQNADSDNEEQDADSQMDPEQ